MSTGITRCLEFHMVHDPETATVHLVMVALMPDGQRVKYEGEGTYRRGEDEPHASLSIETYPIDAGLGDGWREYISGRTPTATSSCKVGELRVTKPLTRTFVEPEGQKLIEEETERG